MAKKPAKPAIEPQAEPEAKPVNRIIVDDGRFGGTVHVSTNGRTFNLPVMQKITVSDEAIDALGNADVSWRRVKED